MLSVYGLSVVAFLLYLSRTLLQGLLITVIREWDHTKQYANRRATRSKLKKSHVHKTSHTSKALGVLQATSNNSGNNVPPAGQLYHSTTKTKKQCLGAYVVAPRRKDEKDLDYMVLAMRFAKLTLYDELNERSSYVPHTSRPYRWCSTCSTTLRLGETRLQHIKASRNHFTCRWDKDDPFEYASAEQFKQEHTCFAWVMCYACDKPRAFKNASSLDAHRWTDHLICVHCEHIARIVFKSKADLRSHKSIAHSNCFCSYCDLDFDSDHSKESHFEDLHTPCRVCKQWYSIHAALEEHWDSYCHFCKRALDSPERKAAHMPTFHASCEICLHYDCEDEAFWEAHDEQAHGIRKPQHISTAIWEWIKQRMRAPPSASPPPTSPPEVSEGQIIDVYAILRIDPQASIDAVKKAARRRRIETHPDRLNRSGGELTDEERERMVEEAKMVGYAADILTDVEARAEYDLMYWE